MLYHILFLVATRDLARYPWVLQAIEVSKRQMKLRETSGNGDMISRLEAAESKLQELKSNMGTLGKEAVAAMTAVEAQQQRLTLQRLIAMVYLIFVWLNHLIISSFALSSTIASNDT